ncbi:polysaccharide deacetylase [Teichococcus aestuarii]|uniref:polysaccharide deacetylase n=1 Tax=Teichococcus aestuarii TaxID=568898 RepID=UPI00361CA917
MQPSGLSLAVPFVPLALEEEDVATYAGIAEGLGCSVERCAEGFMLATPTGREAAVRLWQAIMMLRTVQDGRARQHALYRLKAEEALGNLRALLGLDPAGLPLEALVAAGLRYPN